MFGCQFFTNVPANNVNKFNIITTKKIVLSIFFAAFCFIYFLNSNNAHAIDCDDDTKCGIGRIRSCSTGSPEKLNPDPTMNGADIMFDLSNPICASIAATAYVDVKTSIAVMCKMCGLNQYPSVTPSPVRDTYLIGLGTVKAASTANPACLAAVAVASTSLTKALAVLYSIYATAQIVFDGTKVCGSGWFDIDKKKYNISAPALKNTAEEYVKNNPNASMADLQYRQWYYGGVEYSDNPAGDEDYCEDPTQNKTNGHYPPQKYYLKGTPHGNFNCEKYDMSRMSTVYLDLFKDRQSDFKKAYECCKSRSQNYVCIDYKPDISKSTNVDLGANQIKEESVFCKSGSKCSIGGIVFSAAPLETGDNRLICAQTYSLCPFNFTIGQGGTKYCDYYQDGVQNNDGSYTYITPEDIEKATNPEAPTNDCNQKSEIRNSDCTYNEKAGQCKNYCQYLTHCTIAGKSDYQYRSALTSPYFSRACLNFVGDSRNVSAYDSGVLLGNQRHFSAPIAQCVKETLENVFYNKAGHTQCRNIDEYPLSDGSCRSGQYYTSGSFTFKEGNSVKETSFFSRLQNSLQDVIKMVLTLSIMFFGVKILVAHNMTEIKKSDLIMYCIKIGMVMYFATGDAWQSIFFEGVYNSSTFFSKLVFHVESTFPDLKKDGCQFDYTSLGAANYYPEGKDYLSLWDTLDCKITRYLGFGANTSVANIAMLIFAGLFTGPFGLYFVIGLMFFGFFFIALAIRALHIFLSSAVAIIMMVYISPIIIPMSLFSKTSGMFKKWLSNLISFCLQPMILFAYIGIFIIVFDSTMIGSATFTGNPPNKTISCSPVCKDTSGNVVNGDNNCTQAGNSWTGGVCKDSAGNNPDDISIASACLAKGYVYTNDQCMNGNTVVNITENEACIILGYNLEGATCKNAAGADVGGDPECILPGHTLVNPMDDSIACLINVNDYKKVNFLETIGIAIPAIANLFNSNIKQKILTIIKAAFVMYVLCQFVDQIPDITSQLLGGTALPGGKTSGTDLLKQAAGIAEGIRGRATRGGAKFAKDTGKSISETRDKAKMGGEKSSAESPHTGNRDVEGGSSDNKSSQVQGGGQDNSENGVQGNGENEPH